MTSKDKSALRTMLKQQMSALSQDYCRNADESILAQIKAMPEYENAGTIFCFVGTVQEIQTIPLISDALRRGKRVGVPLCTGKGIMEVRLIQVLEELSPGAFGIPEPGQMAPVIAPEDIQLAIVPCLSCTADGRRLGYGGGYYDRYLPQVSGTKCVICRRKMMMEELPVEAHDCRMDVVVWEKIPHPA